MTRKRLVKLLMADGAEKRCADAIASEVVRFYGKYKIGGYCWIDLRKPENKGRLERWRRESNAGSAGGAGTTAQPGNAH